jgi:hypothetical protein
MEVTSFILTMKPGIKKMKFRFFDTDVLGEQKIMSDYKLSDILMTKTQDYLRL